VDTLFHYSVEPEIVDGIKKLGMDPGRPVSFHRARRWGRTAQPERVSVHR
jgi:hypothetical protein